MNNKKQFTETVDILVKAYFNETLRHGDCTACAVGNIVAKKCYGLNGRIPESLKRRGWYSVSVSCAESVIYENYHSKSKREIDSTGYSPEELISIEKAFEYDVSFIEEDDDGYHGLMRVVDRLIKIHEGTEQEAKEAKELFVV